MRCECRLIEHWAASANEKRSSLEQRKCRSLIVFFLDRGGCFCSQLFKIINGANGFGILGVAPHQHGIVSFPLSCEISFNENHLIVICTVLCCVCQSYPICRWQRAVCCRKHYVIKYNVSLIQQIMRSARALTNQVF